MLSVKCKKCAIELACSLPFKYGNLSALFPSPLEPTMAVNRSDIAKLAVLARIAISDDDADEVASRISTVLALVDQLQTVNTDGVLPMAHPLDAVQRLRADVVTEPNQRELFQSIAPAVQDGLYLVPQVIE
jgi:aspartyl-tRNA(Asn)/glutamyl-tRNA(Gln) amidotransferase subunit C